MDNKTKIFINHTDGVDASTYISNEYICVSEEEIKKFFASLSAAPLPNDKLRELMNQRKYVSYNSKEHKALEIMQRCDLKPSDITRYENYQDFIKECYLSIDGKIDGDCPSEDEFALLKEVLL